MFMRYRKPIPSGRQTLFSVALFLALLFMFKESVFSVRCPAVSCEPPTGCIGACYSSLNPVLFFLIVLISLVLPVAVYRIYYRFFW